MTNSDFNNWLRHIRGHLRKARDNYERRVLGESFSELEQAQEQLQDLKEKLMEEMKIIAP